MLRLDRRLILSSQVSICVFCVFCGSIFLAYRRARHAEIVDLDGPLPWRSIAAQLRYDGSTMRNSRAELADRHIDLN
ncbi:MAG: hypothetical protein WB509_30835 [Acetobacteraceae bacterium]|jgi:hypothetical protein